MTTQTVKASKLLKMALTDEEFSKIDESDSDSWYFSYQATGSQQIFVECTASQTMESLLQFKVDAQRRFFEAVTVALPEPGDSMVVENDRNGSKRRVAFITRLKPHAGEDKLVARLLMTR